MLQMTFSVSLLPDSGWPQLFLLPDLTFCSFFLGGEMFVHMHMCMHTCAPAWRPQVVSAPTALELQEYAAVPSFVWEGWGSDQVIMPAQWTFCSPRHPHSPPPQHTFSPLESSVISTRDTVLKSNFPLQPPQSIA